MSAPAKPDAAAGMGALGLLRAVTGNAPAIIAELKDQAGEFRRKADENDQLALALAQMHAIAERHVPTERQGVLELSKERISA